MERQYTKEVKKFVGRVAIISGGAGDIGSAIALELARQGADIAIGDIKEPEEVKPLLKKLRDAGVEVLYTKIDTSNSDGVNNWVEYVEEKLGVPDVIIPCAAQATARDMISITAEEWEKEIDVDLNGAFYLARKCAVRLLENRKTGHIVFIGSWAGHFPQRHNPSYGVAKAGLTALTKVMTLEFAPHGILANEIAPGNVFAGLSKKYYDENPGEAEKDAAVTPTRKLVKAEEIAQGVVFLSGPDNKNITGHSLFIDGGMSSLPDFTQLRKE